MTLEHSVLERMENMGIKVVCFLENGHFLQNMGVRGLIFHEKPPAFVPKLGPKRPCYQNNIIL